MKCRGTIAQPNWHIKITITMLNEHCWKNHRPLGWTETKQSSCFWWRNWGPYWWRHVHNHLGMESGPNPASWIHLPDSLSTILFFACRDYWTSKVLIPFAPRELQYSDFSFSPPSLPPFYLNHLLEHPLPYLAQSNLLIRLCDRFLVKWHLLLFLKTSW